jgi:hypothetical protein
MSTTVREDSAVEFDPSALARRWSLVVVHHRSVAVLGRRRVIAAGAALDIGRACGAFGDGALDDPQLSRAHARFELDPRGALTVNDLGSANGTWVDGARVGVAALRAGSIVRTGPVLFAVQHAPETYPMRRSERAPAVAWSTVEFGQRLRSMLASREVVCVDAACAGAWREHAECVAEELGLSLRSVASLADARALGPSQVPVLSAQLARASRDELLSWRSSPLIIDGTLDGLSARTARLPALVDRLEDLPWIVRAALARAVGQSVEMDAGFAARLLMASWPEDVDGVHRWAQAVARRPERHERLAWVGEDLALTGGPREAPSDPPAPSAREAQPSGERLVLARDGTWFRAAGEAPVDLRTRIALARIMRALAAAHSEDPRKTLSLEDIVNAGWPGEKLVSDSGANRVYVAVATLRKLGLRDAIERREGGYRLATHESLTLSDAEFDAEGTR